MDELDEWEEIEPEYEEEDNPSSSGKAHEHVKQLERLKDKDPEFYAFLKEHDKELLDFNEEDIEDDEEGDSDGGVKSRSAIEKEKHVKVITSEMVDNWCKIIKDGKTWAVRPLLRAFQAACHYGDAGYNNSEHKLGTMSSNVFNKIMLFVLNEMDGILRGLLKAPNSGGRRETVMELMVTAPWKRYGFLMRQYLSNAYHILNEMTDEQMISYTLKCIKVSGVFLAAFPSLLRKYIKVVTHTWVTGRGAMPIVSFLFLRDLCVRLGSDCLETCLKGLYKAYALNCKLSKTVSASKMKHIQFLVNCVTELYGLDPPVAYQHAFNFIRQLAVVLRFALNERGPSTKATKERKKDKKHKEVDKPTKKQIERTYQKVYDWQYIFCLELWMSVICTYDSEAGFRPLAYPLSQIIHGVACLAPSARYIPLRLRCVKMLNRIAAATRTFIPVSSLLLDVLKMKHLREQPTGGVGKAVNLFNVKQVDKVTLNTRSFQEACIYEVVEELAEHLSQWSYSIAFFEISFIPLVQLRDYCKTTRADKLRREVKELIRQVDANVEFTNSKRVCINFSPNDPDTGSFLKDEKEKASSPLSKYMAVLLSRKQNRKNAMLETSVIVGAESSVFTSKVSKIDVQDEELDADEGASVFSSSWMPEKKSDAPKKKKSKKRNNCEQDLVASDEDVVEDLVLSSDEEDKGDDHGTDDEEQAETGTKRRKHKAGLKQRPAKKGKPLLNDRAKDGTVLKDGNSKKRNRPHKGKTRGGGMPMKGKPLNKKARK